jgi:hypothetical protein
MQQLQTNKATIADLGDLTNDAGYLKSITGYDVFSALGYIPQEQRLFENLKEHPAFKNMSPPANRDMLKMTGQNTEAMNKRLTDPEISSKIKNSKEMSSIIANKEATLESLIALRGIIRRISQKNNLNIDIDMMNSR